MSKQELGMGCKPLYPGVSVSYGYVPTLGAGIAFCTLFGLSMILHTAQFCWKRTWWCSVFSIGAMGEWHTLWPTPSTRIITHSHATVEVLGWAGRTWSSKCPYNSNAFLMQISTLIIAPTFFTAGIYVLLGRFIQILGRESSILKPSLYLWIFCTCDVISLVVQAIGGGMASGESNKVNGNTKPGTDVMVAGIVFQLFSITIFVLCAADFIRRSMRHQLLQRLSGSVVPLFAAMLLSIVCIYIRSIYRTIELSQGWTGYLITHESYFIGLDGAMMVVAVAIFNVLHPGWLLPSSESVGEKRDITSSADGEETNGVSSSQL
ncbi:RTA-like protein [Penicillium alfredii]|uniref:RTA-like protein n=1 Tax=Penicillium alfredii TaxID=1506179 RepID=A0A9W9FT79_9EURO|nr:RTA-like protein [Penicillium alfredii]KAJ5105918.1 RTA-like protein [Penicillium alfredii]